MSQQISATLEMYCEFLKTIPDAALLADDEGVALSGAMRWRWRFSVAQRMCFGRKTSRK